MIAEKLAKKTLVNISKKNGEIQFPVDPFRLLKDNGINIFLMKFDKLSGVMIIDDKEGITVGINSTEPFTRQRFTAAHEYCHFLKDLKNDVKKIECTKGSKSEIEKYAESFASNLLMPIDKFKEICNQYKNNEGVINNFEDITMIAEYFGVSFKACLTRIAYELNMIEGDISPKSLDKRIRRYQPTKKRKELIEKRLDSKILGNMINVLSYSMIDLKEYTGVKFIQRYIYHDNKLEGVKMDRQELNNMLADLNYNGIKSEFYQQNKVNVVITLGNLELQKFIIRTDEIVSIKKSAELHKLLYKFVPYPQDNGKYRASDAVLFRGAIQPPACTEIGFLLEKLDSELNYFMENINDYTFSEYIEQVAYFVYKFVVIHPFGDGNGRISRALLNWMLKTKGLPPIYIDANCRDEYYEALSQIDKYENYIPFITLIERRIINTMMELHEHLFLEEDS